MITPSPTVKRVVSLDQFRGYTVAGMFLVNFLGGYASVPAWLKHHNTYNSYPDTIMPQFFFAVGFAYRLTFLKRRERDGAAAACAGVVAAVPGPDPPGRGALSPRRTREELGRAAGARPVGVPQHGLPARSLPDARPHRDHLDLGAPRDRGRCVDARASSSWRPRRFTWGSPGNSITTGS